jgi:hypothetical protein
MTWGFVVVAERVELERGGEGCGAVWFVGET